MLLGQNRGFILLLLASINNDQIHKEYMITLGSHL